MDISSKDLLSNIFPDAYYAVHRNCQPSWKLNRTTLNFHNLMLIYDGEGTFYKDGDRFTVSKGELIYFKPGDIREAYTSSSKLMKCFAVEFLYTCPILKDSHWQLQDCDLPFSTCQRIEDEYLFRRLMDLFTEFTDLKLSMKGTAAVKERALFTEILSLLIKYKNGTHYSYSNLKKVEKVVNYMVQNYTENITLKKLGDYLNISPSYLGNIFKEVTGQSVIDYLIHIRINKAKHFLIDGLTVSETAKKVGFNDIFYFSRAFKKYEGLTPSQFAENPTAY
ncbi:helix-turn-helix transcriptional regulator [Clostridium sp. 19966]|uniref:AraC family transcriptional regulator n=1 Tax=Clostridium sp. 19966 TaxID=2768166 RepID=UPI0028DF23AF|nr:AraC family transcriptional regulator [Clostridium sp. 19966]MDT8716210.1 helix-turn-helix transcriptional regulator [Clostridium sp. 19966]